MVIYRLQCHWAVVDKAWIANDDREDRAETNTATQYRMEACHLLICDIKTLRAPLAQIDRMAREDEEEVTGHRPEVTVLPEVADTAHLLREAIMDREVISEAAHHQVRPAEVEDTDHLHKTCGVHRHKAERVHLPNMPILLITAVQWPRQARCAPLHLRR